MARSPHLTVVIAVVGAVALRAAPGFPAPAAHEVLFSHSVGLMAPVHSYEVCIFGDGAALVALRPGAETSSAFTFRLDRDEMAALKALVDAAAILAAPQPEAPADPAMRRSFLRVTAEGRQRTLWFG